MKTTKTLGAVTWTVDTSVFDRKQRKLLASVKDASKPLVAWWHYVSHDIATEWDKMTFGKLYLQGGMFRGAVPWKPVQPMYTRKDGTRVPPWGGPAARVVLKKDGTEAKRQPKVKGRKRGKTGRVKITSIVGKNTKNMVNKFTREPKLHANKRAISLVTNTKYAEFQNNLRQFNRLIQRDKDRLVHELKLWLDGLAKEWNRAA